MDLEDADARLGDLEDRITRLLERTEELRQRAPDVMRDRFAEASEQIGDVLDKAFEEVMAQFSTEARDLRNTIQTLQQRTSDFPKRVEASIADIQSRLEAAENTLEDEFTDQVEELGDRIGSRATDLQEYGSEVIGEVVETSEAFAERLVTLIERLNEKITETHTTSETEVHSVVEQVASEQYQHIENLQARMQQIQGLLARIESVLETTGNVVQGKDVIVDGVQRTNVSTEVALDILMELRAQFERV